jgi:hypothetical protein
MSLSINMRELVLKRVMSCIETGRHEFPCGFETMMEEEGLTLPKRYIGISWDEDPTWIVKVIEYIPKMSDKLLLEVWEQFLCLEFR